MNATSAAPPQALCCFHDQRRRSTGFTLPRRRHDTSPAQSPALHISSSLFRPRRPRPRRHRPRPLDPYPSNDKPPSPSDQKFEFLIDIDAIADRASTSLTRLHSSSESRLRRFLSSGADAYHDLRTSVRIERGHRIVFSCRRSSLVFVENLFFWSLATVLAVRVLDWLLSGLQFRLGWGKGYRPVIRRDRSLAGREVVVGEKTKGRVAEVKGLGASVNPLSPPRGADGKTGEDLLGKRAAKREELPKWWPDSVPSPVVSVQNQEYQSEANRLVRAIMDNRLSGKDFKDDDIIQLRRICKVSGAKVSFETANSRDSFYRAAVNLVLNSCRGETQPTTTVQIDGEEVRQFISGLASNIGLENVHAARLVRAAVAVHTRSSFLQSWALEVQGRRSEALEELSKICQIHRIFPPEENSPEMEMVAAGLKKHLRVEQREHLLSLVKGICGAESQRVAAEALGLMDFRVQGTGNVAASE